MKIGQYGHKQNWTKNGHGTQTSDPKHDTRSGQNTVSTVALLCTFLRIENRIKINRHVFCSRKVVLTKKGVGWLSVGDKYP